MEGIWNYKMKNGIGFVVLLVLLWSEAVPAADFMSLSLARAANASRRDERAEDGKGGWLDLGSNDLRLLPDGRTEFGGVPFVVPPCADETARTCLVLGRAGEETAELETPACTGGCLYLLHAVAGGPKAAKKEIVAEIGCDYTDGTKSNHHIRKGRDVGDWTGNKSFANAARAWSVYNRHTQVSLYVTVLRLTRGKTLAKIRFRAKGRCPWMVLAATVGDQVAVKALVPNFDLTATFDAPPARPKRLERGVAGRRPRNVILVIGDGMGPNTMRLASLYLHGREDALQMQQLPVAGLCTTHAADSAVTDSAAAGTALATGEKTSVAVLGLGVASKEERSNPRRLVSTAEKAHAAGLAVALITNDPITGATPGAFYAHVRGRGEGGGIAQQAMDSGYEVLVGASSARTHFLPRTLGGGRKDGRNLLEEMGASGWSCVTTQQAFASAPKGNKVIGFFLNEPQPERSVAEAVRVALARVGDAPKGFFMMCEGSLTDHGNHRNNPVESVKGALHVDWAVKAALDFAEKRDDTLVIVTADHETGGVSVSRSRDGGKVTVDYASSSHTQMPVALYAYGPGAECFEGRLDNTDIAKRIQKLLGF